MFRYAPAPREGETLYSVLARLGTYLNTNGAGPLMREMLGRRHGIASIDLPGHLAVLVRDMDSSKLKIAIDLIIDELTAFPFYTAFAPADVRASVRAAMHGDTTGIYTRLGLATFKLRPPERLRFCVECLQEMEEERGDAWWRREHQLPGVFACFSHGTVLKLSDVHVGDRNRHNFIAASRGVCPGDAELSITVSPENVGRLTSLARSVANLLSNPPTALSFADTSDRYRQRLSGVGLMRSAMKVDHVRLRVAFAERWGDLPEFIPGLRLSENSQYCWLSALVRTGRRAAHPIHHLMLRAMLDSLQTAPVKQPFGPGPWACRNSVSDHQGQPVISSVRTRRDGDTIYGDFECSCGYLYTRALASDGSLGQPRYRRFGHLLVPALVSAVQRKESLRSTARLLGLDPKTLMREAAIAGVPVPWSLASSGRIPAPPSPAQPAEMKSAKSRQVRKRRNWAFIDARLVRSASRARMDILAGLPPVRVTLAELERRIARKDWVTNRRAKLPVTIAKLEGFAESTDEFRHRRLEWCVQEAVKSGDLRPCEVLRKAGLPTRWMSSVRQALSSVQIRGREAA